MALVHPEASMEPSIQRIHEQAAVAQMEHPRVAWWHLSGLGTLPGEGNTPMSPKYRLRASNCCIWVFLPVCNAFMISCLILSSCGTASKGLTLLKHQL